MKTINVFGITFSCFKYLFNNLHFRLVSRHFGKGGIQLFCDGLEFVLLIHKLIFQSVNLVSYIILEYQDKTILYDNDKISTSFCNFTTDFSANSALVSDCFSLPVNLLISVL